MSDEQRPGPTGDFPDGKLNKQDEGGLNMAIKTQNGRVVVDFGKQLSWLAMPPEIARGFANLLLRAAEGVEKEKSDAN